MTTPRELSDRELEKLYSEANGVNAVAALRAVYNAGRNPPKEETPTTTTGTVHSAFTPETPTVPVTTPARAGVTTPTRAEATPASTSVKK